MNQTQTLKHREPESVRRNNENVWAERLSIGTLSRIMNNGVGKAYDGCTVEPDGSCPHGYSSPLILLGMI
jgi:hypothetical protein